MSCISTSFSYPQNAKSAITCAQAHDQYDPLTLPREVVETGTREDQIREVCHSTREEGYPAGISSPEAANCGNLPLPPPARNVALAPPSGRRTAEDGPLHMARDLSRVQEA